MKNPPLHISLRAALKRPLAAMAIGATALLINLPQVKAATLNYTFTGVAPSPGNPVDPNNFQGWTSILATPWASYNFFPGLVDDGHLGDGFQEALTQLGRSPAFKLDASGPLICKMFGTPSLAATPVSAAGVPTIRSAEITADGIVDAGFMGVALREVATDTYVLWKAHTGSDFNASPPVFSDVVFSVAELAPYANDGKIYSLDFIDNSKFPTGGDNWAILGGATIPGSIVSVAKTYNFNDGTLQGWHNRVWNATTSTWVDLAPDVETMPSTVNGGVIQPPSANNSLFANNGTRVEPVGVNVDNHLNTLWLRSPVFKLAPYQDLTAQLTGGEGSSDAPENDVSVLFTAYSEGWKGMALRRVSDGAFVLVKPTTTPDSTTLETLTFSQAELSPFVGVDCTLELINIKNGTSGSLTMDNVSIPVPPSNACEMLTFGTGGVISGTNVSLFVPFGTDLATLAPTCTVSADASYTGPIPSFSVANPSSYIVTAQDGTKKTYTVTINFGSPSTACDLLTFAFPGQLDTVISGLNVSVTVPATTDVTNLKPTYTASPFAAGLPVSNTAKDFTNPQSYTITSQSGGASKTYVVTVTKGAVPSIFNWNSALAGNWSDPSKWTNDLASVLKPASDGTNFYTLNFNQPGTYTATNNLNANFTLNQLNFASSATIAGAGSLTFTPNGAVLPQINQNSGEAATINSPVILAAAMTVAGSASGRVTLDGLVSGTGSLTKNGPGTLVLNGFDPAAGSTFVAVPNTYSGGTFINGGVLQLGSLVNGITPLSINPAGTNPITLNTGGSIQFNSVSISNALIVNSGALNNYNGWGVVASGPVTLNATVPLETLGDFDMKGVISGVGGITKTGVGRLLLSGVNTYSGDTTVNTGTLVVNGTSIKDTNKLVIGGGKVTPTGTEVVNSLFFGTVQQAAGTWGSSGSTATNKDDVHFSGNDGMVSVLTGSSPVSDFDSWLSAYATITLPADKLPTADPDGDGMTNQQEYAFGLNPTSASSVNPITALLDSTTGKFSYTRRATPATTGLIYTVLTSPDLVTWTADTGATQTIVTNGNVQTVAVTLTNPAVAGKLFVRVKAASAP